MDWVQIAQSFGIPFVCLAVLVYGVWQTITWTGENIIKPIVQRVLAFFDRLETIGAEQAAAISKIAETQSRQTEILQAHSDELKAIKEHVGLGWTARPAGNGGKS